MVSLGFKRINIRMIRRTFGDSDLRSSVPDLHLRVSTSEAWERVLDLLSLGRARKISTTTFLKILGCNSPIADQ